MISASELKETFGQSQDIDDDVWDELIKNADKDGNGEIDLKEFKEIMLQIMWFTKIFKFELSLILLAEWNKLII